jgi:hypothetical protein
MRFFEKLITTTRGYDLRIIGETEEVGFLLYAPVEDSRRRQCVGATATLQACKELALEKYGAPMDGWRSEGGYFESLIAKIKHSKGYTFRIVEGRGEGFYLYVFDADQYEIRDDLQDTVQACKEIALEMYGVPIDAWSEEA